MRKTSCLLALLALINPAAAAPAGQPPMTGNPILPGWYADPEAAIFDHKYWIYPTYSAHAGQPDQSASFTPAQLQARQGKIWAPFLTQTFFNAFSSRDLVTWEKHSHVLDVADVSWAAYALWAPAIVRKDDRYFLFFSANDIKNNAQLGGIGVAVATSPAGPFRDHLGRPLIGQIHHGAQPIDQCVFRDTDGQYYLVYGGWKHCNLAKLNDTFTDLVPFADGETFKSITPENYVEGPFLFKRREKYYLMWSEGNWTGPDYCVAYAMADSPLGPFKRLATVLAQDPAVARGAGHHSVINIPQTDEWYIVYHRRPLTTKDPNQRETCIDRMEFDEAGLIRPVKITFEGVPRRPLP
jgi:beta-xylosidase